MENCRLPLSGESSAVFWLLYKEQGTGRRRSRELGRDARCVCVSYIDFPCSRYGRQQLGKACGKKCVEGCELLNGRGAGTDSHHQIRLHFVETEILLIGTPMNTRKVRRGSRSVYSSWVRKHFFFFAFSC